MAKKKRRRKTVAMEAPAPEKPTMLIDSKDLSGDSLKVGKKARVLVTGKITEESLRNWEAKDRKSYRMEIDKVTVAKLKKKLGA